MSANFGIFFETVIERMNELSKPVRFSPGAPAVPIQDVSPPENAWAWTSDFAVVLALPLTGSQEAAFDTAVESGTGWLGAFLEDAEKNGRLVDGYLVLALQKKPEAGHWQAVWSQRIGLDTNVCRKQVVWPDELGDWTTLNAVTVLSLPTMVPVTAPATESPQLTPAAEAALNLYRSLENYDLAAERLVRITTNISDTGHVD